MELNKEFIEILVFMVKKVRKDPYECLADQCKPLIFGAIDKYYISGFEREDYWQEANKALFEAVNKYDILQERDFTYYFYQLMINHFNDLVRRDLALKRRGNTTKRSHIEIDTALEERKQRDSYAGNTPEEALLIKEAYEEYIPLLSPFEKKVLTATMEANTKEEIAQELKCTKEKVNHALYRCKQKLKQMI